LEIFERNLKAALPQHYSSNNFMNSHFVIVTFEVLKLEEQASDDSIVRAVDVSDFGTFSAFTEAPSNNGSVVYSSIATFTTTPGNGAGSLTIEVSTAYM
jgi:hypothetical protein